MIILIEAARVVQVRAPGPDQGLTRQTPYVLLLNSSSIIMSLQADTFVEWWPLSNSMLDKVSCVRREVSRFSHDPIGQNTSSSARVRRKFSELGHRATKQP